MKISIQYLAVLMLALPFLGGCGKQGAFEKADLSSLEQGFESRQTIDNVSVTVKRLTPKDREYVFGKKNLSFSPVLMTVENRGNEAFFFDAKKQVFRLVELGSDNKKLSGAADSESNLIPVGVGFMAVSLAGGTLSSMHFNCPKSVLYSFTTSYCLGIGLVLCGLFRKCKDMVCSKRSRAKYLSNSKYLVKAGNKESILLFFEKNMVPGVLNIALESAAGATKTLLFELSTNRASQAN